MEITNEQFDALVDEVWQKLPADMQEQIDNVGIIIEPESTQDQRNRAKAKGHLLGLFEGVPKVAWGYGSSGLIPNKITLFRNPIKLLSKDLEQLKSTVHIVLMHEIAHYLGYNEDDMCVMDKKMRDKLAKKNKE